MSLGIALYCTLLYSIVLYYIVLYVLYLGELKRSRESVWLLAGRTNSLHTFIFIFIFISLRRFFLVSIYEKHWRRRLFFSFFSFFFFFFR